MQKVQIISYALTLLGQKPINSLLNQNNITTAAEQSFDFLLPVILSTGFWRFATKIQQLSQLVTVPIVTEWQYIYQLPADYLKAVRQYPHNYAYEIFEQSQLYSNVQAPLYLEYIYQPVVSMLPPYFNIYLAYRIAQDLGLSNAHNVQFSSVLEQRMGVMMSQALAADAQNRPQTPLISQPIISDRGVTSLING